MSKEEETVQTNEEEELDDWYVSSLETDSANTS